MLTMLTVQLSDRPADTVAIEYRWAEDVPSAPPRSLPRSIPRRSEDDRSVHLLAAGEPGRGHSRRRAHTNVPRRAATATWEFLETPELRQAKQEIKKLNGALDILSTPFPRAMTR